MVYSYRLTLSGSKVKHRHCVPKNSLGEHVKQNERKKSSKHEQNGRRKRRSEKN